MSLPEPLGERYSLIQIANLLHVHPSTVWRWISVGVRGRKLRSFLLGGRRAIYSCDLRQFLANDELSTHVDEGRARRIDERLASFGISKKPRV